MSSLADLIQDYFNLNQTASEIAASIVIFAFAVLVCWISYLVFEKYFTRWARKTKTKLDDEILRNIKAPVILLAILVGTHYGLQPLTMLSPYIEVTAALFIVAEILVLTFTITRIANVLVEWYAKKTEKRGKRVSHHILYVLKRVTQAAVYLFAFFAILVVFNIDLSGLIVGLGVGGIAIALALQNILSDAFSAFSIYFDRPFEIGDFIVVGEHAGTVKKIGMKSTRLQLLQGEELIISNKELTTTHVRNFKRLRRRRIAFNVNVTYDTPTKKLRKAPEILSMILEKNEFAQLETVHLRKLGDSSLVFEVVYYMKIVDYEKYLDTQQEINFAILEAFEKEGIKMALPSQTIFLSK